MIYFLGSGFGVLFGVGGWRGVAGGLLFYFLFLFTYLSFYLLCGVFFPFSSPFLFHFSPDIQVVQLLCSTISATIWSCLCLLFSLGLFRRCCPTQPQSSRQNFTIRPETGYLPNNLWRKLCSLNCFFMSDVVCQAVQAAIVSPQVKNLRCGP